MEAALGTAVGTLQREWYWTRALDARAVGAAAALLVASSGDGVQWLSQGSVSAAAATLAQGSAQGGSGTGKGSAGRPWLVDEYLKYSFYPYDLVSFLVFLC